MKKLMCILFILFCVASAFPTAPSNAEGRKLIGISNLWVGNEVNRDLLRIIRDNLKKKGCKVISMNAEGDRELQQKHVELFINKKFDGIIIKGGVGGDFEELATKAYKNNINLVGVEMYLKDAIVSVGSPDYTYQAMAEWMAKNMNYSGKYMVITNFGWHPLDEREEHAYKAMSKYPEIKHVRDGSYSVGLHDPLNENYKVIKKVIQEHPDIKGVVATWGIPVVSAAKAVVEAGKSDQISIIGCDADMPILSLMMKDNAPRIAIMGWKAVEMSEKAAELMDKSYEYGNTEIAKQKMGYVHRTKPFFVTNTGDDDLFKPHGVMNPDQAWDYVHQDKQKPW